MRFTFSPYLQLLIAFAGKLFILPITVNTRVKFSWLKKGVLSKQWVFKNGSVYYALALLIIGPGLMLLTKIIAVVFREMKERKERMLRANKF